MGMMTLIPKAEEYVKAAAREGRITKEIAMIEDLVIALKSERKCRAEAEEGMREVRARLTEALRCLENVKTLL